MTADSAAIDNPAAANEASDATLAEEKLPPTPKPRPKSSRPRESTARTIPPADPEQVVGLTEAEASSLIGPPDRSDVEPPARVWEYDGRRCTLRVFFYLDLGRETYRALTYSIAHDEGERPDEWRCFGQILNSARSRA